MKGYEINATFLLHFMNSLRETCDRLYPKQITDGMGNMYYAGSLHNGTYYRIEVK